MCFVFSVPYSIRDHKREHRRSLRREEHDWRHLCCRCSGLWDKEEGESRLLAHIPLQFPRLSSAGKEWIQRQTFPYVTCFWLEVPGKCSPLNYLTPAKIVKYLCNILSPFPPLRYVWWSTFPESSGITSQFRVIQVLLALYFTGLRITLRHAVAQFVGAPRYEPEGRGFVSRWGHWDFSLTQSSRPHYGPGFDSACNRN